MAALIDLLLPSLALLGCYLCLAWRVRWPPARTVSFVAGLCALTAGLAVDDLSLTLHMAGHGAVVAVAAPLLVLGRPLTLLLRALPTAMARDLARLLRSIPQAVFWPPLALFAFIAAQLAFHLTSLYGDALGEGALHEVEHLLFLVTALWLWTVCLAVEPLPRRGWSPLARAGLLMAAMMLADIGSVKLMVDGEPAAGAAMTASMLPLGIGAAAITWAAMVREERRAVRREAFHAA
jgi:putative membrane protein